MLHEFQYMFWQDIFDEADIESICNASHICFLGCTIVEINLQRPCCEGSNIISTTRPRCIISAKVKRGNIYEMHACMNACICVHVECMSVSIYTIYEYARMHACMNEYVCVYLCTRVFLYVFMHAFVCTYISIYVCTWICMHICMHVGKNIMYVYLYVCRYAWMYVCIYVYNIKIYNITYRHHKAFAD